MFVPFKILSDLLTQFRRGADKIRFRRTVRLVAKGKYQEWLTPEGLLKLEAWARNGLTDEQIASNCGITAATLYVWKKDHAEISEALKRGKEVVDVEVENALLKRALGYTFTETTSELVDGVMTVTKKVEKEVSPDTTAQIFWLKNRKPADWRDKRETELSGSVDGVIKVELTDD